MKFMEKFISYLVVLFVASIMSTTYASVTFEDVEIVYNLSDHKQLEEFEGHPKTTLRLEALDIQVEGEDGEFKYILRPGVDVPFIQAVCISVGEGDIQEVRSYKGRKNIPSLMCRNGEGVSVGLVLTGAEKANAYVYKGRLARITDEELKRFYMLEEKYGALPQSRVGDLYSRLSSWLSGFFDDVVVNLEEGGPPAHPNSEQPQMGLELDLSLVGLSGWYEMK